ncbi:hypothetical protein B0H63DRAFT_423207 [Podospora didyma]|uniref:Short-chain dehydrogenase/reductase 3 n=1 Tax=Podospora didyma TaxID=330526 RepID=A0AAE0N2J3_9PEZI|nr:hypothetical protein B0H63DRAFT_423207 [Podospora didyma]
MASVLRSPVFRAIAQLGSTILSPLVAGPLLLAATFYPEAVRPIFDSVTGSRGSTLITALQAIVALGVVRKVNQVLNIMASNSWRVAPRSDWDWQKEIAVVTGGSSGIGKDIAKGLAALGVRVAVLDIQDPPKNIASNPLICFYHCDVTSSESVTAAADSIRNDLGHPSILINNAGVAQPAPILKTNEAFLRRILGVNLMSLWFTTQQFLPNMVEKNKGHVFTVASVASFVALATSADYSATKAGALAFHETLGVELKHKYEATNVLTSIIHPNFVRTPLLNGLSERLEKAGVRLLESEMIAGEVVAQIKSGRGGQLVIPRASTFISGIRGWPTWLQEIVRDSVAKVAVEHD